MLKQGTANPGLDTIPVTALKGVGPRAAERLAKLGISRVQDILFHLPLRYQDRTRVSRIRELRPGAEAVIEGEVRDAELRFGRKRSLLVAIDDGTGLITLRFFHFSQAQQRALSVGARLRCFGEVRNGPNSLELVHPEYQRLEPDQAADVEQVLTPIYPTTEGLHQLSWRGMTEQALELLKNQPAALPDWLPEALLRRFQLTELSEALEYLHRPPAEAPQGQLLAGEHPAQRRLVFEELVAHQLSLRRVRQQQKRIAAPQLNVEGELTRKLLSQLPFALTAAQQRVIREVADDLRSAHPMLRLVQGDVGSGKTVVAAIAALQAVEAGYQVAMMAPTELLAEQHLRSFCTWLEPLDIDPVWLSGRHRGKQRQQLLESIAAGEARLVVGTHALFQEDVMFPALGLVIIDEQHRFGVHQRLAFRDKGARQGCVPHQLIMTATPIPRTLAMSAYADLDLSVIDELPPGRIPVTTVVVADTRREQVIDRVRNACAEGRQAYWVCTLIEESEALQCQAAENSSQQLAAALPDQRVGLLHGRMGAAEKEQVMGAFKGGELDLLVATTVVEVGVDVPNASLMIIENPERLGLAQLHQLRGRVGRGGTESFCLLMYHPPLSGNSRQRLGVMRDTNDGFVIAEKDLELRGPGEVLGTRQTGEMDLRIADLVRDQGQLPAVQAAAEMVLNDYPGHVEPLIRRWLGDRTEYGMV